MAITILHAESFRLNPFKLIQRYTYTLWNGVVNALIWDGASLGRHQVGRGTAPQGWALSGDGAPNNAFWGLRTTDMLTPTTPAAGNIAEWFAYSRGGDGGACTLAEYGEADGSKKHLVVSVNASNKIVATNGDGTVIGTSTYSFPLGTATSTPAYTEVEIIPFIHPTLGWLKVYADGVLVLGIQNKNTTNVLASDTAIGMMQRFMTYQHILTDYIVHDAGHHGSTYDAAESLGKGMRAEAFAPTVAGSRTAGTAVGAASRLLAVNDLEHASDIDHLFTDDDTYVELDDTGLAKGLSFTTAALPAEAKTVFCVCPMGLVRKDNAGANTGRLLLKSGSTETDGTSDGLGAYSPSTDYAPLGRIAMVDPATSASWTISGANAAEVGYERVS